MKPMQQDVPPIRIEAVRVTAGIGGHWINDQMAVQTGATADGYFFEGPTSSPAFPAVRSPSVAYLVSLDLADGQTAHGDCTTVANAGYAGRPLPLRREDVQAVQAVLQESLAGRSFAGFREAAGALDAMPLADTLRLPVEYGVSQALLEAAALASRTRMVDVLCREFGRPGPTRGPGFAGSCGGAWEANVDKAIVRGLDMFPQSAIQSRAECERLPDYAAWIAGRIRKLGAAGYRPDLHFDFHSSLGRMLDNDEDRVLDYLATICERAAGLTVFFEDPMLSGSAAEARERMGSLRAKLDARLPNARLIADEWANGPGNVRAFAASGAAHAVQIKMPDNGSLLTTIDAIQGCQEHGTLAYLGGSCNETDISSRASIHVGLAFGAWRMLTKPGLGFDEGLMIMTNEISRTLSKR
ncbi:methylaspartate ammonia-lyase [Bordetella bronchiseptica]|uniref:methylaspartate ammonia-lyase n=2 Tax=Bordetella bronchiseptica TaxID=518 RepID=A0A0C6PC75_BORBO|nr:methylaspartate ammonia-lyase [Bordetella bronchiseptica]SHP50846.1 Methylaspartate ammonia-lyase [Mycobacteroides abscessus subsp. abscessus]AWP76834.1 methylaspartate ammonia-lyase [Bordetella bronchiseptica]AZW23665.1 methylaspartate ammonia-lyase [Bordetella bronchiseptica]KFJ54736.1 methylaspartate ammonia-lyase [Bordetella bronchiseptica]MCE7074557.1 methylaspartate ammonia-lyase [Bordetella bronchiseptica]